MSLELVNTLATFGTFVVIAATARRHRATEPRSKQQSDCRAQRTSRNDGELSAKLQDPAFRYQVAARSARTDEARALIAKVNAIGNFYESMGVLVKTGLVDRELVLQVWDGVVINAWEHLAPIAAIWRRKAGPALWEKFEYLMVLAQDWQAAHPKGTYPAGMRRIALKDEWLEADKLYAASLAPA
jgi:hypothetical protein